MKKILSFAIVALAAFAVKAEYLYWQVDRGDNNTSVDSTTYVKLWASETANDKFWSSGFSEKSGYVSADGGGYAQFDLSGDTTTNYQSYFVEYLTYDNSKYTTQGGYYGSWNDLKNAGLLSSALTSSAAQLQAYTGGTYTSVPEPTSGLMLLMGMALVALKRKRA